MFTITASAHGFNNSSDPNGFIDVLGFDSTASFFRFYRYLNGPWQTQHSYNLLNNPAEYVVQAGIVTDTGSYTTGVASGTVTHNSLQFFAIENGTPVSMGSASYGSIASGIYGITTNAIYINQPVAQTFIANIGLAIANDINANGYAFIGSEAVDRFRLSLSSTEGGYLTGGGLIQGLGGNDILGGANGNDTIEGGEGNDSLEGGVGNDSLDGGAGNDTLVGGNGDDRYIVDNSLDVIQGETSTGGTDTVVSSFSYTLASFLENLELQSGPGAGLVGTGNAQNNALLGGAGNDTLTGGAGDDVIDGAGGVDTASYAGALAVTVSLATTAQQDTVGAGLDTLTGIEQLIGSSLGDRLTGSSIANRLDGGDGADTLNGGAGNDTLIGGLGNDSLHGGTGVGRDNLSGGDGTDSLAGGLGNDRLTGGAGVDTFLFNTALGPTNIDTITDFSVPDDTIRLASAIFTAFSGFAGVLEDAAFHIGSAAHDDTDRIIYDSATGALYYDPDGNLQGGQAQIQFATLSPGLALTRADFRVI